MKLKDLIEVLACVRFKLFEESEKETELNSIGIFYKKDLGLKNYLDYEVEMVSPDLFEGYNTGLSIIIKK
jgi:hypothetical protein